jgi:Asp-tRNA(Asn)/Glu-tRNA(Gln) amidotransferase A subunit family amidase
VAAQDFAGKSVDAIVRAFVSGKARARDIIDGTLDRCKRAEPFNPIATLDTDGVRAAADALDARRKAGGPVGSLAAVPVSAKDLILTGGLRTAFASLTMKDNVPAEDAAAIAQWRAADALLFAGTRRRSSVTRC